MRQKVEATWPPRAWPRTGFRHIPLSQGSPAFRGEEVARGVVRAHRPGRDVWQSWQTLHYTQGFLESCIGPHNTEGPDVLMVWLGASRVPRYKNSLFLLLRKKLNSSLSLN